jgi:hypothetical protein
MKISPSSNDGDWGFTRVKPQTDIGLYLICVLTITLCAGCAKTAPAPATPLYTPIVSLPEGTVLPSQAMVVSVADLSTHPEGYQDKFVKVNGINAGYYAKPACSPYFGPPTEWLLLSELPISKDNIMTNNPDRIQVKNNFGGMISSPSDPSGFTVRNPLLKQVAVWGWVRLYEGLVGCGFTDSQGTPVPMDTQRVWYIDAVQLQYLESIEVR